MHNHNYSSSGYRRTKGFLDYTGIIGSAGAGDYEIARRPGDTYVVVRGGISEERARVAD